MFRLVKFGAFAALTISMVELLTNILSSSPYVFIALVLPGTIMHESMHWISAYVLGGGPHGFTLIPVFHGSDITLGSVDFTPNGYNAATVAAAPFLLLPLSAVFVALASATKRLALIPVYLWFSATAWIMCEPSDADMAIALGAKPTIPLALFVLGIGTILAFVVLRRVLFPVKSRS